MYDDAKPTNKNEIECRFDMNCIFELLNTESALLIQFPLQNFNFDFHIIFIRQQLITSIDFMLRMTHIILQNSTSMKRAKTRYKSL